MKCAVYFEQINQDRIEVEADTVAEAVIKAKMLWRQNNLPACVSEVEEEGSEGFL